jgi:hypothetical protein
MSNVECRSEYRGNEKVNTERGVYMSTLDILRFNIRYY